MILTARRSLVQKMARHQQPHIEIFFLNITVRRDHLVTDSLKEISEKQKDLKKKLKVLLTFQFFLRLESGQMHLVLSSPLQLVCKLEPM